MVETHVSTSVLRFVEGRKQRFDSKILTEIINVLNKAKYIQATDSERRYLPCVMCVYKGKLTYPCIVQYNQRPIEYKENKQILLIELS
ncbi:unnamed protein product [Malus baccata var. baccata]